MLDKLMAVSWNEAQTLVYFAFSFFFISFQEWHDAFLQWDPSESWNITDVQVPINNIWRPDIILHNKYVIHGPHTKRHLPDAGPTQDCVSDWRILWRTV